MTYLQAGIGGTQNQDLSCHDCLIPCGQADALPTKLYQLGRVCGLYFKVKILFYSGLIFNIKVINVFKQCGKFRLANQPNNFEGYR